MRSIALLLVVSIAAIAVAACVFLPGQNTAPSLTSQQKDAARQILLNDKGIGNLSGVGEPELFDTGDNASHALAIVPVMQNNSQYVDNAFIVDLNRNLTVARINCGIKNLTFDRVKTIANLTVNAPLVSDDFWDGRRYDFTINIDGYGNTAPGYISWSGQFISISVSSLYQYRHDINVVIEDPASRVISVIDLNIGPEYTYHTRYVILPPGKEIYFGIVSYPFDATEKYPFLWMTKVKFEPNDSKIYPVIVDKDNFNRITQVTSSNALEYTDFVTDDLQQYNGDRVITSGWTANISLNHSANLYLIIKNAETNKDVRAEVNIFPDREMREIVADIWPREANNSTTRG
jgi:hypothetical protein